MSYDFVTFGRTKLYYINDDFNIDSGVIDIIQPVNPGGTDSPDDIFVVRHKEAGSQNEYKHINLTRKDIRFDYEDAKDMLIDKLKKHRSKFGVSIDMFLGDVDVDGNYSIATTLTIPTEVNLVGVKHISEEKAFDAFFQGKNITKFIADDLIEVSKRYAFQYVVKNTNITDFSCANLESINGQYCFYQACMNANSLKNINLRKVKSIAGYYTCGNMFYSETKAIPPIPIEEIFPTLEEITDGYGSLYNFVNYNVYVKEGKPLIFPSLKKIVGGGNYEPTFGYWSTEGLVFHFPVATEVTGYLFRTTAQQTGEIHFAAANQAAIEACDGYANKWGFTGATIYFDL